MEAVLFLLAGGSAIAVAALVQVWMRVEARAVTDHAAAGGPPMPGTVPSPWLLTPILLILALVAAWMHRRESIVVLSQTLLLLYVLYALALLDWVTLEVELRLVLAALVLRIALLFLFDRSTVPEAVLGMVTGAGMISLASLAYRAVRGRSGLGEGDAGVLAIAGSYVGWAGLVPVLLLAAAAGAILGGILLVVQRKPLDTPIPFVPFLCAATLAVYGAQHMGLHLWSAG